MVISKRLGIMNNMDTFNNWTPVKDLVGEFFIIDVHQDHEGLKILLKAESENSISILITFTQYLLYKNVDESGRIRLWAHAEFEDPKWQFCVSTNSSLIKWLKEESDGIYEDRKMTHYLIKTWTDVLDVISEVEPKVTIIK